MSLLSRYLDPETLSRLAGRRIEPRGLVIGNLAGAHRSPLAGFAVEFAGHREYLPGDDPRHIDWRLYFNRDRYFIKQYEMETNLVCHFALDVSASMRYGDDAEQKLFYAAQLVATLAQLVVRQSDQVSLTTFDESLHATIPPSSSPAQLLRMTEHLDAIEPRQKTNLAESLSELSARVGRRQIVMLVSDFLGDPAPLEPALQRFRYAGHEVVLFHVLHHDEWTFDFRGPVKFVGLESADELATQPGDIRSEYLAALARYTSRFDELCQRNRVERVPLDTSRNLADGIVDYLNHRSRLNRGR